MRLNRGLHFCIGAGLEPDGACPPFQFVYLAIQRHRRRGSPSLKGPRVHIGLARNDLPPRPPKACSEKLNEFIPAKIGELLQGHCFSFESDPGFQVSKVSFANATESIPGSRSML